MNKCILSILLFSITILTYSQQYAIIEIQGKDFRVDTLASMKAGPGSYYSAVRLKSLEGSTYIRAYVLEVDTENPYITFEATLGKDSIVTTELVTDMAERKSKKNALYFAGTNADFFVTEGNVGYPVHGCVVEGQIARIPASTPFMAFDGSDPFMDIISFNGSYCKIGEKSLPINNVNVSREENQLILYNSLNGNYTHTNQYGKEVLVELRESLDWSVNTSLKAKVVKIENNKGCMEIPANHAVLSAHGTAIEFLDKLTEEDEVEIFLGLKFSNFEDGPVRAMVGGDRIILQNGEVTNNDWADLHPRTAIGYSADKKKIYFCVVDGRLGAYAGVSTKQLADIIKNAGAYDAINLDGGGSSAMYIHEMGIMNVPSDGKERAVSNAIYAVSTAPEDNTITEIRSSVNSILIPRYGIYTPLFYGYNQYGLLINNNLEGVIISCSEDMGEVMDGKTFIASGSKGGILYADYNGITTAIQIQLTTDVEPSVKLDTIIADKNHPYMIEVQAVAGGILSQLLPKAFQWSVEEGDICSVSVDGVIIGLSSGETDVVGKLGDEIVKIHVIVQIPESDPMAITDIKEFEWDVNSTANVVDVTLSSHLTPININYIYTGGRGPFVELKQELPLYSIPTLIRVIINSEFSLSNISITTRSSTEKSFRAHQFTGIIPGEDYIAELKLEDILSDVNERSFYPVYISGIEMTLDPSNHPLNESANIVLKEFSIAYENLTVNVRNLNLIPLVRVYPNPVTGGQAYISLDTSSLEQVRVELCSYSGQVMFRSNLAVYSQNELMLPLQGIAPGIYLMKVYIGETIETIKIILQ